MYVLFEWDLSLKQSQLEDTFSNGITLPTLAWTMQLADHIILFPS